MSSMSMLHRGFRDPHWTTSAVKDTYEENSVQDWRKDTQDNTRFQSGLPTPPGTKAMPGVVLGSNYYGFASQRFAQNQDAVTDGSTAASQYHPETLITESSNYNLIPSTATTSSYGRTISEQKSANSIAPHLQIPESVNKSKGSLAEFAAEITCLFWFETAATLQHAEEFTVDGRVERGLLPDAVPTIGFRKWVTTIISTTQVGKNVILLALMFIYRLKRFNPTVSGKRGSEFRLLTIALMLGNKFLDDNTYTNKTWAEVSGISVTEIHIMEVEFLSNMRYDLYASAAEWNEWKAKLGRFGAFYDKASQLPLADDSRPAGPVTPTSQHFPQKLPSPPSTHHSVSPYAANNPLTNSFPTLPYPNSPLRQQRVPSVIHQERKRSLDYSADGPPAKRPHYPTVVNTQPSGVHHALPYTPSSLRVSPTATTNTPLTSLSSMASDIPRLEITRTGTTSLMNAGQLAPLSVPTSRAMSSVYPSVSTAYSQPMTPISAVPQNLYQNPIPNLGDGPRSATAFPSTHTSPSHGFSNGTPTLPGLSPSYFLTHRASPYRPVRNVNTLLIPPPSAAMQNSVRTIPTDQIHYQPLSKRGTDRRTGLLPFMHPDGWQQSNVSTPVATQPPAF